MQAEAAALGPLVALAVLDVAEVPHRVEHLVAPPQRGVLVALRERVIARRRLRQPGDQRGLGQVQLRGGLVEERARGGLGAVGVVAVEDGVEVRREDVRLGHLVLELQRQPGLVDLAPERALGGDVLQVDVAHHLLRDRRGALDDLPARDVAPGGASDALVVDAVVRPEAPVLDRHRAVAQPGRDLLPAQPAAVLVGRDHAEALLAALRVDRVDDRVLAEGRCLLILEIRQVVDERGGRERRARRRRRPRWRSARCSTRPQRARRPSRLRRRSSRLRRREPTISRPSSSSSGVTPAAPAASGPARAARPPRAWRRPRRTPSRAPRAPPRGRPGRPRPRAAGASPPTARSR